MYILNEFCYHGLYNIFMSSSYTFSTKKYAQYIEYIAEFLYDRIIMVIQMISYEPFYRTLFKKDMTEYNLIYLQGISANTIHRIKHGEAITTKTLDTLCFVLQCGVNDIIEYRKEDE